MEKKKIPEKQSKGHSAVMHSILYEYGNMKLLYCRTVKNWSVKLNKLAFLGQKPTADQKVRWQLMQQGKTGTMEENRDNGGGNP